ncbi:MAG: signal peptidase II [Planctomycetes bacterium]|nr:signal peptidase II [Planctomycetota bacterium]
MKDFAKSPESRPGRLKAWSLFVGITAAIAAVDLWSKAAVFEWLQVKVELVPHNGPDDLRPHVAHQKRIEVLPGLFELEANFNTGAFSGWFSRHTSVLTAISALAALIIVGVVFFTLRQPHPANLWFIAALGLVCGGTIGNFYDRLTMNAVRDWIKWFFVYEGKEHVWPNFNIADSGICVGVVLLLLTELLVKRRPLERQPAG